MEIKIRNLTFSFGKQSGAPCHQEKSASDPDRPFQLSIPELNLKSGLSHAWVGPSGSGKTTALRLLAGILRPGQPSEPDSNFQKTELKIGGTDLTRLSDAELRRFRSEHLGLVFQDFKLLEYLNVLENILLPVRLVSGNKRGMSRRRIDLDLDLDLIKHRAEELLNRVGLEGKGRRSVSQLSQGEQQRVAICRALILQPKLALADEPTGNLDPRAKVAVMQLLREECQKLNATLLVVTHDHELLEGLDSVTDFSTFYPSPPSASISPYSSSHPSAEPFPPNSSTANT